MDDIKIVKACALAMGYTLCESTPDTGIWITVFEDGYHHDERFDPLHDDAQAMALVRRFKLGLLCDDRDNMWLAEEWPNYEGAKCGADLDLNRAICLCVASMSAAGCTERER